MVKSKENLLGAYSFLIGVILAIIFGLLSDSLSSASTVFYTAIILIGCIVGFLNMGDKDNHTFLLASVSIVIVGALGLEPLIYLGGKNIVVDTLRNVLGSLLILFIPATVIVAIKTVFSIAKI